MTDEDRTAQVAAIRDLIAAELTHDRFMKLDDGELAAVLYDAGLRSGAPDTDPLRTALANLDERVADLMAYKREHPVSGGIGTRIIGVADAHAHLQAAALRATPDAGALPEKPPAIDLVPGLLARNARLEAEVAHWKAVAMGTTETGDRRINERAAPPGREAGA